MMAPLSDLLVVELGGDVATRYCGKLFAAHGARVLQTYTPDNRNLGYRGQASTSYGAWLDHGKERAAAFTKGIAPDVVIAGQTPTDIAAAEMLVREFSSRPLLLALTWFGTVGPYASWKGTDAIIQAMTGISYAFGPVDGPPVLPQGHAPQILAGATATIAAMAALIGRRGGHSVDRVDTNVLEAHLCFSEHSGPGFAAGGPAAVRRGLNRYFPVYPQTIFPAIDGWIGVTALTPLQWRELCALIGLPDLADDPAYATTELRMAAARELDAILGPALLKYQTAHLLEEGQRRRVPMAPVPTMRQLLQTPHWRERRSFQKFEDESVQFEGSAMPFRLQRCSAPAVKRPVASTGPTKSGAGPLAGLRVLDLSMGWSGPLTGRHYADLGADVIKVEGCRHIDWWRGWNALEQSDPPSYEMRANFNAVNRNKQGITLDLTNPRGGDILRRMVEDADLLIENYAPGVLDRLGFSAKALGEINPELVYISMGAFGSTGPWAGFRAYGSTTEQASGMPFLHGDAAWPPIMQHTAYGDPVAGIYAAVATLIALYGRQKTGGATIDLSQVECLFQLAADGIIAQSATGSPPPRTGNQRTTSVWRGCLRCRGDDAWIAVDIEHASSLPDEVLPGGVSNLSQDQIGTALATWAAGQSIGTAVELLQRAKIAAGPVTPAHALLQDPHLIAAGYWRQSQRRYVGAHLVPKPPFAIDGRAPPLESPAPTLGEHNNAVLTRVLGLQPTEINELERTGIIGSKAT